MQFKGSLLLNVGLKSDGAISDEDYSVLTEIGEWLKINGEAIYESRPWRVAQEGPELDTNKVVVIKIYLD